MSIWSRGESNPCPRTAYGKALHACPLFAFRRVFGKTTRAFPVAGSLGLASSLSLRVEEQTFRSQPVILCAPQPEGSGDPEPLTGLKVRLGRSRPADCWLGSLGGHKAGELHDGVRLYCCDDDLRGQRRPRHAPFPSAIRSKPVRPLLTGCSPPESHGCPESRGRYLITCWTHALD